MEGGLSFVSDDSSHAPLMREKLVEIHEGRACVVRAKKKKASEAAEKNRASGGNTDGQTMKGEKETREMRQTDVNHSF